MQEREPMTQTMSTSDVSRAIDQIVKRVSKQETRVVVVKDGKPLVAIISVQDLAQLKQFERQREQDFSIIDDMQAAFKDVPEEELEAEIAKALAEVRADARAANQRAADPS